MDLESLKRASSRAGFAFDRFTQRWSPGENIDWTRPDNDEAFEEWFAGSRVVDRRGRPLTVYHGTHSWFCRFREGRAGGIYFSPYREAALRYGPPLHAFLSFRKILDTINVRRHANLLIHIFNELGGWSFNEEEVESRGGNPYYDDELDYLDQLFDSGFIADQLLTMGYEGILFNTAGYLQRPFPVYVALDPARVWIVRRER